MHVHAHLIIHGFIKEYKYECWNKHGQIGINDDELGTDDNEVSINGDDEQMDEDLPERQPDQDGIHEG